MEMYSTLNEGKSVVAERFIRILKNNIYKYITSMSKDVYIDKLDIVNKYNNTNHSTIKMKPADVTPITMIKILNLKLLMLLRYQNIKISTFLQKTMLQIDKKFLRLKKLKTLYCGHFLLVILTEKKLLERFPK